MANVGKLVNTYVAEEVEEVVEVPVAEKTPVEVSDLVDADA